MSEFDMDHPGMSPEEMEAVEREREAAYERELAPFRAFRRKANAGLRSAIAAGKVSDEEVDGMKEALPPWVQGSIEAPVQYTAGDAYTDEGIVWVCKQSHTCTSHVEKPGTATLALWRRATPVGVGPWQENTDYATGAEVIDPIDKLSYLCLQGHTSLAGWEPSKTPALWKKKE